MILNFTVDERAGNQVLNPEIGTKKPAWRIAQLGQVIRSDISFIRSGPGKVKTAAGPVNTVVQRVPPVEHNVSKEGNFGQDDNGCIWMYIDQVDRADLRVKSKVPPFGIDRIECLQSAVTLFAVTGYIIIPDTDGRFCPQIAKNISQIKRRRPGADMTIIKCAELVSTLDIINEPTIVFPQPGTHRVPRFIPCSVVIGHVILVIPDVVEVGIFITRQD